MPESVKSSLQSDKLVSLALEPRSEMVECARTVGLERIVLYFAVQNTGDSPSAKESSRLHCRFLPLPFRFLWCVICRSKLEFFVKQEISGISQVSQIDRSVSHLTIK